MQKSVLLITLSLNVHNSISIAHRLFKFSEVILDIITEGTLSQISFIVALDFILRNLENIFSEFCKMFPVLFCIKNNN